MPAVKSMHFDRCLYDKCCGDHPRFSKENDLWYAQCIGCGQSVGTRKPEELFTAWNIECRKGKP